MAIVSYFIKVVSLEYLEFSDDNATAISAFSVGIMGESSSPTVLRSCYRGAVADHNMISIADVQVTCTADSRATQPTRSPCRPYSSSALVASAFAVHPKAAQPVAHTGPQLIVSMTIYAQECGRSLPATSWAGSRSSTP
jgi:hypothetical protein